MLYALFSPFFIHLSTFLNIYLRERKREIKIDGDNTNVVD